MEENRHSNWIWAKSCDPGEQEQPYIMLFRKTIEIQGMPEKGNHGMFCTALPGLYVTGWVSDDAGRRYDLSADFSWKCRRDDRVAFVREEERFAPLIVHEKAQGNPAVFG